MFAVRPFDNAVLRHLVQSCRNTDASSHLYHRRHCRHDDHNLSAESVTSSDIITHSRL